MDKQSTSEEQLNSEVERLRQELENLTREKADLEILLETTTAHADNITTLLQEANKKLQAEVRERQRIQEALEASQAELQSILTVVTRDKNDLEIILETTTQHGDIVENIRYDQAIKVDREREKMLRQFLEAVTVGVFVIDMNGKPYYANKVAIQLLGKEVIKAKNKEELVQKLPLFLAGTQEKYPPEKLPSALALQGETSWVDDVEIHQNDRVIPIEAWGKPILNENGQVIYAIVTFQDITDRKRAAAEQQAFTNQLFELNRSLQQSLDTELQITEAYGRFVPHEFLYFLGYESIIEVKLGDCVEQEMSVLFSDIRDFTILSETMTPEENFKFINAYLSRMEPAIVENHGFIDKFIGDAIMALFSGNADDAVKAGITMIKLLETYNQHRKNCNYPPIRIGVGINTGLMMLGTVGGKNRVSSTAISDSVNVAAHLESLTKNYGVSLLISHYTFSRLEDANQYAIRFVDRLKVKGKSKMVAVYEVFDADRPEMREGKLVTKGIFEESVLLYHQKKFSLAEKGFKRCLEINTLDKLTQIYIDRCQANY